MLKRAALAVVVCVASGSAFSHGGGLDKCGGHKDKKRGGYHVHNVVKYCACNPKAPECAAPQETPANKKR